MEDAAEDVCSECPAQLAVAWYQSRDPAGHASSTVGRRPDARPSGSVVVGRPESAPVGADARRARSAGCRRRCLRRMGPCGARRPGPDPVPSRRRLCRLLGRDSPSDHGRPGSARAPTRVQPRLSPRSRAPVSGCARRRRRGVPLAAGAGRRRRLGSPRRRLSRWWARARDVVARPRRGAAVAGGRGLFLAVDRPGRHRRIPHDEQRALRDVPPGQRQRLRETLSRRRVGPAPVRVAAVRGPGWAAAAAPASRLQRTPAG